MYIKIIKFCSIDCNYFKKYDIFYKQKRGLAMLSGILAELTLDDILNDALINLNIHPTIIVKYVDDEILCAVTVNLLQNILQKLNSMTAHLKFTIGKEENSQIPFPDILIIRNSTPA